MALDTITGLALILESLPMRSCLRKTPMARPGRLTRRRFMQASGVIGVCWGFGAPARAAGSTLEAYAGATSVKQGGTIEFFARDPLASWRFGRSVNAAVVRVGAPDQTLLTTTVKLRNQSVPSNASTAGCGWHVTWRLEVPAAWPSGLYYAMFGSGSNVCTVPFVVSAARQTVGAKVLVQVPVTTAQAYNNYGGKSLYAYNSTGGLPATQVSFDRPHTSALNFAFDPWQAPLVRWLAKNGIAADFCTSIDLHQNTAVLTGYQLFVTAGHDEYWSRPMRERLDAFVAAGGNAAVFGGNTCWWQIRFEADALGSANRSLVCYKSSAADPETRAAYKTVNWIDLVPPDPENSSFGLGWNLGASWTNTFARPDTPYVVQRGEHWAFEGTDFGLGTTFGGAYVGYEIDALDFRRAADGRPYPTFADGTPTTLTVLALADASRWDAQAKALGVAREKSGFGAISIHSRGGAQGAVFNAGSVDWVRGLQAELDGQVATPISRITHNVVTKLSDPHRESADVRRHRNVQSSGDGSRYFITIGNDAPAGATLDGMAFRAYAAAGADTAPVNRYKYPQVNGDGLRYFYNLHPNVGNGWINDVVAFHAYATAGVGRVPVYQHHIAQANGDGWRFFYSTLPSEPGGWLMDGVAFFAPAT